MSEKLIELNCMSCNKTFLGEEPEYCCNGSGCAEPRMSVIKKYDKKWKLKKLF